MREMTPQTSQTRLLQGLLLVQTMLLLIALAMTSAAYAADDYFTGAALQTGELSEARLIRDALAQVLVKLTGRLDIVAEPGLQPLLQDAQALVTGFSYREQRAPGNEFDDADRYLLASFDRRELQRRLRQAQAPIWSPERPDLLMWLAIEQQDGARRMLGNDEDLLRYQLLQRANFRGLPLLLPLQDQTDYALVQPQSIWGGFDEDALLASERYAADQTVIVTAAVVRTAGASYWQARWRLHNSEGLDIFTSSGADLLTALLAGLDQLTEISASQASVSQFSEQAQSVVVRLPVIDSPAQLGRAWQALSALSQLQSLQWLEAGEHGIELRLRMRAGVDWLQQAILYSNDLRLLDGDIAKQRVTPEDGAGSAFDRARIPIMIVR